MALLTKLDPQRFEKSLGSWWRLMKPFIMDGGLDPVSDFLGRCKTPVYPNKTDLWKPFQLCQYKDLKLVIAAEGPYLNDMGDGLALSVYPDPAKEKWIPEPLDMFYDSIEQEIHDGLCLSCVRMPSLEYLAKQGVLLLNVPMTGDKKNGPHNEIWEPFIKYLLQEAIGYTGVPVMFLGKEIWKYEECLTPWQERFLLQYPKLGWDSKGAFKKVKEIMMDTNGMGILWMEDLPF